MRDASVVHSDFQRDWGTTKLTWKEGKINSLGTMMEKTKERKSREGSRKGSVASVAPPPLHHPEASSCVVKELQRDSRVNIALPQQIHYKDHTTTLQWSYYNHEYHSCDHHFNYKRLLCSSFFTIFITTATLAQPSFSTNLFLQVFYSSYSYFQNYYSVSEQTPFF